MVSAVGIDLSLTATGVARSDGSCALFGKPGITNLAWATQLRILSDLRKQIVDYALDHHPDVAVIEGLDMAQSYGGQIQRSRLWCDVVQDLILDGLNVYVAPSPQVKMYATGKGQLPRGREGKKLIIAAVTEQWPLFQHNGNDNMADAAVMCAMAAHLADEPMSQVSDLQIRGLAKTLSVYETTGGRTAG